MNIVFSPVLISAIRAFYMWIIALSLGSIACAGAFSAPVIFNAGDFGVALEKSESGILMTHIFLRLNNLLLIVAFVIAAFETFALNLSRDTRLNKAILFLSGAISVICILLFSLYYTPYIVAQQELGDTQSAEFLSMHAQSESVAGILFLALSVNLIFRIMLHSKIRAKNAH